MPTASSPEPNGQRPPLWRRIAFHPLMAVPLFVLITQRLGEGVYPFSHFPMYSNPSEWDDYIYLTDGQDRPLPIQHHVGLSAARLNKIYNTTMKGHGLKQSAQKKSVPPATEAKIGTEILEKARRLSVNRRRPLPEPVRLYRVIVERQPDGRLTEATHLVTEG